MSPALIGSLGLLALFVLVLLHIPLGFALALVGIVAFALQTSWGPALTFLASEPVQVLGSVDLAAVPMFLMMGAFVSAAGFSKDLYTAAAALLGHRRGGLAYATLGGSATFGAICGSSPATVATFTRIALPEMLQRGYEPGFSGATIAAGGALKALIPPSLSMILYCVVAQVYIFDIFLAAVVPAIMTLMANFLAVWLIARTLNSPAPAGPAITREEKIAALWAAGPAIGLILVVFVGLYSGVFTVNEAAAVAAVLSFLCLVFRHGFAVDLILRAFIDTAAVAGMIYVVLIGSAVFTYFISLAHLPEIIVGSVTAVDLPPLMIIGMILVIYLVLGAVFDELAAMVVTVPFALPVVVHLGYDPVWWGIINVVIVELGLIIPPVGMVVLIVHGMRPDISLRALYRGVAAFVVADAIVLALLVFFPGLTTWLPGLF